ncbi:hypothetical protein OXX80_013824, partial [Metschnikowia pulcherrima]
LALNTTMVRMFFSFFNAAKLSKYGGMWFSVQVGVKAPGTDTNNTLEPAFCSINLSNFKGSGLAHANASSFFDGRQVNWNVGKLDARGEAGSGRNGHFLVCVNAGSLDNLGVNKLNGDYKLMTARIPPGLIVATPQQLVSLGHVRAPITATDGA